MPDVQWFAGATLNYARNALRTAWTDPDRTAIIFDSARGRAGSLSYGRSRPAGGARRARPGRARRRPRRPGRRPAAERPRGGRRPARHREPGRDLVVVLAGLRRAQRDRPVRADRAEGAHRLRRLRLQRQGVSTGPRWSRRSPPPCPAWPRWSWSTDLGGDGHRAARRGHAWDDLGAAERAEPARATEFEDGAVRATRSGCVYSSGTTGLPKPIMHGHGGIVLEHLKALSLPPGPAARATCSSGTPPPAG